ncbi:MULTISPECIES: hypothetical protein [unclassified Streptomyces]|uniref:hypothetical protein n=1 Tax=Streptomyces sp. NPDC127532 TaxID=3345399 RepID=UPI0036272F40
MSRPGAITIRRTRCRDRGSRTPLVGCSAPAMLKEKWCRSDEDKSGTEEKTPWPPRVPGESARRGCDNDGKATAFAFRNAKGEIVSWTYVGGAGGR